MLVYYSCLSLLTFELTIDSKDTSEAHSADEYDNEGIQLDSKPACGGQEEKPALGVVVLVPVEVVGKSLLGLESSHGAQTS